jgi:translation initiation factor IF-2
MYFALKTLSGAPSLYLLLTSAKRCQHLILSLAVTPRVSVSFFHTTSVEWKRRKTAEERKAPKIIEYAPKPKANPDSVVSIWKNMTVSELATAMVKDTDHVLEVFKYVDDSVKYDSPEATIDNMKVIQTAVKKSGLRFKIIPPPSTLQEAMEPRTKDISRKPPADPSDLVRRSPVVTIMGHVDHGKTTLLDSLRHSRVVDKEFGGITQHIGAFSVSLPDTKESITFLDTPGHAAFKAMRARGANATDIVVLVVAADDGVMEQTVESIRMAREAQVPIIVAINKIDKPGADISRTRDMLLTQGLQLEEEGGDIQSVPISALHGTNLSQLLQAIAVQAEIMELKSDPNGLVEGVVIESKTDARRGKLSTALVQRGTLKRGSILVSGIAYAKVRAMFDDSGQPISDAPPSTPVEILGWRDLPMAGDDILEVESEKIAHEVIRFRESLRLQKKQEDDREVVDAKATEQRKIYRTQLEAKWKLGRYKMKKTGPREKEMKNEDTGPSFNIVLKGDVGGSVEAILDVLETYDGEESCKLSMVHYGVGNVSENDVELAEAFNGVLYTFNVDTPSKVKAFARTKKVEIQNHNVIYKLIDDIKEQISLRLPPKQVENIIGEANVLQYFEITEGKKKISIAGSRCTKGNLKKGCKVRVFRQREIIYEGVLQSLRHLKAEVDTIKKDVECGIRLDNPKFEFLAGDLIQCYELREEVQKCEWDPGF